MSTPALPSAAPLAPAAASAPSSSSATISPPPSSSISSSSSSSATLVAPSPDPIAKRVLLPRCAAWFALDGVSSVERRMLPEFFEHDALHRAQFPPGAKLPSSKTPQIYIKYRNYMVHAYRQQPHVYLTATACRRNLAGDACAILRVHEFLTHWGIINYDVPPHALPPAAPAPANYHLQPATNRSIAVLATGNDATPMATAAAPRQCERCGGASVAFELTPDAKKTLGGANNSGKRDLPLHAFALRPGSGVCEDCYLSRSFPDGVDAADFARLPPTAQWSQDEDALLVEAVSASGGDACDWSQIAGKVKTKSAEECVVRFLELPLLPQVASVGREKAPAFGYADSANAAVLDMARLVRDVDPFVAKAAARAAIQAIHELHKLPPAEVRAAGVKREALGASEDVEMANGDAEDSSVAAAAAAVEAASDAAGVVVKTEPANGSSTAADDVDMASAEASTSATAAATPVAKETLAVVQEASHATAAALLAAQAHRVASETAQGPVRGLATQLLENQLAQMELKLQQVGVLEQALRVERELLTRERHALYMDRLAFAQQKLLHGGGTSATL